MRWLPTLALVVVGCSSPHSQITTKEQLGAVLFEDPQLSEPPGQACADCHTLAAGFADAEGDRTSAGVIKGRFGTRNAQPLMYAQFAPPLHRDPASGRMLGGLFWDGRANTLEEQAAPPLLNPLEMNNPDKASVVKKVRAKYARAFRAVFGPGALDDPDRGFAHITEALAAFQRTPTFAPFSSKYDRYLAGTATLDDREQRGLAIFEDPARGNCASCHPSRPGPDGSPPLFTNFAYENLELPRFRDNPFYLLPPPLNPDGQSFVDHGLATTTGDPRHDGMFRVPTLRNITRTGPYGHNGYFRRLDEMIAFLNHRDAAAAACTPGHAGCVPPAEVPTTSTRDRLGHLALSKQDIADLVAFLATLLDAQVESAEPPPS